jgi:hypothetical protein
MADSDLTPSERQIADSLRLLAQDPVTWTEPPAGLWSRIEQALSAAEPPPGTTGDQYSQASTDNHASTGNQASTDNVEQLHTRREKRPRPRTVPRRSLLAVAAGGLIAGLGLGAISWQQLDSRRADVLATAELTPLDAPDRLGTAEVLRTPAGLELRLAAATPFVGQSDYIEVWLINRDGQRMISVGVYSGQTTESFPITADLLQEGYVVVDLSSELFDDDPTHSGNSLVRGQLDV